MSAPDHAAAPAPRRVSFQVTLEGQALAYLDKLVASGFYGRSRSTAARALLLDELRQLAKERAHRALASEGERS